MKLLEYSFELELEQFKHEQFKRALIFCTGRPLSILIKRPVKNCTEYELEFFANLDLDFITEEYTVLSQIVFACCTFSGDENGDFEEESEAQLEEQNRELIMEIRKAKKVKREEVDRLEAEKDAEKQRASQMFAEAKAKAKADSVEKQQKKIRMQQLQDDRAILIAEYHGVLRDGVILSATNLPFLKNEVY